MAMNGVPANMQEPEETMPEYVARQENVWYVTREEDFEAAWGMFFVDGMGFAGIDCEFFNVHGVWGDKKVALLQLTGPRCTLLYHVARMSTEAYREQMEVHGEYVCGQRPSFMTNLSQISNCLASWCAG